MILSHLESQKQDLLFRLIYKRDRPFVAVFLFYFLDHICPVCEWISATGRAASLRIIGWSEVRFLVASALFHPHPRLSSGIQSSIWRHPPEFSLYRGSRQTALITCVHGWAGAPLWADRVMTQWLTKPYWTQWICSLLFKAGDDAVRYPRRRFCALNLSLSLLLGECQSMSIRCQLFYFRGS